jgi:pectin methylesterase-like acyl-CoA thioesterase
MSRLSSLCSLVACATLFACASNKMHTAGPTGGTDGTGGIGGAAGSSGVGGSGPVVPAPPLLMVVGDRFPAADSTGICTDAQLRLTFTVPVKVGIAGKIQVFKVSAPDVAVDTVDVAGPTFEDTIGGRHFFKNRPVFIDGMQAIIYLHRSAPLVANETYFVTVGAGVFVDPVAGAPLGEITGPSDWRFTTRAVAPASPGNLVVSLDSTADFCSVQSAIDFIPAMNTTPVTVTIKNGTYREIVFINTKHNITIHGEDRKNTIISYANNNTLQIPPGATVSLGTAFRATVEVEKSNDLVVENITLRNPTPQGGSQAEVIRAEPADRVILRDADFISLQDTLLLSGRAYVTNCYVEGNVDFIWGKGTVYFDKCEIKTVGRKGYNVQARNPSNLYGYVFVDSKLTSDPGITGHMLARVDATVYPGSHVAYINCQMGSHIDPTGWVLTPVGADASLIRFWEYQSVDLAGAPIDVSKRIAASKQLSDAEAVVMRDKATIFALPLPVWNPTP